MSTKTPQDRKPAADSTAALKTVTVSGVKLSLDPGLFDDLDVLDALDQINEGNGLRIAGALRHLTGDSYDEVRTALRDPATGRIPVAAAATFLSELMKALAPNS